MSEAKDAAVYQLRGEIDGRAQRLRLAPGVNRFGSLSDNDIVLKASGISRRHVEIEVGSRHLLLVDLGSKNGTFVNARRARRAHLRVGDEIGVGALELRLERLEGDDAVLGLELSPTTSQAPAAMQRSFSQRDTTRLIQAPGIELVGPWLELIETFLDDLLAERGDQLTGALWRVAQALEVDVCCLVEQAAGAEAGIVAAGGDAGETAIESGLEAFRAAAAELDAGGRSAVARAFHAGGERPVTGRLLSSAGQPALGLLVVGEVAARAEVERLLATLLRLLAHLRAGAAPSRRGGRGVSALRWPPEYVPGTSPAMAALHSQVQAVAPAEAPVLILGETGVGKELIARMVHATSPRRERAFVAINCAAIPGDLLEAELFGVEKGAASGVARRPGMFRRADGGTLFLDEIGDMPVKLQVKLLRALQEREIQPVGGTPVSVDARVVSATNLDLRARVAAEAFRADLYYRLAGHTLTVPALRQRAEDVPGLIEHFLRAACDQLGKTVAGVTAKALRALTRYPWPGNVRELEHEIQRLATLCRDAQAIDFELLSEPVQRGMPDGGVPAAGAPASDVPATGVLKVPPSGAATVAEDDERFHLASHEKRLIRRALEASGGQLTAAARKLGISRDALRRRLTRHGLEVRRG